MNIDNVLKKVEEYGIDDDYYLKFSVGLETEEYELLVEYAKKAMQYEDTLKYISGEVHLTVDTLEEARQVASLVLEEANEQQT